MIKKHVFFVLMLIKSLLYSLSWFVSTQKEWLCLNCQTQRALQGGLDDRGKMAQPSATSAKPETNITPALKTPESKTVPSSKDKTPTKLQPTPAATMAIPTGVSSQDSPQAIPEAKDKEVLLDKAEKLTSEVEKEPSEALKVDSHVSHLPVLQDAAVSQKDIPENLTVADKVEAKKTEKSLIEHPKTEQTKPILSKDHIKHEVVSIETSSSPVTDNKVAVSLSSTVPELSAPQEVSEEVKHDNDNTMLAQTTSFQQIKSQQETKAVPAAESKDVTSITDGDTSIRETEVSTKDMKLKVRLHFLCT